jgi:hypothetical protein
MDSDTGDYWRFRLDMFNGSSRKFEVQGAYDAVNERAKLHMRTGAKRK